MITCPNCKHENLDGSVFCFNCGSQLSGTGSLVTQNIDAEQSTKQTQPIEGKYAPPSSYSFETWASLHLLDSGQILPLSDRMEFTLGRVSEAQPIMPDIDLTPYQAYSCGVSRLHAALKREGKRVFIMDLGSSNGTFLNGKRLQPHVEYLLNHSDIFSLGKLKIQILIKK